MGSGSTRPTTRRPKKARYMSKWESSLYDYKDRSSSAATSLGLQELFDARRWRSSSVASSSSSSSDMTFRLEHREGGALASHQGEERILLFRSDRKGAIAKIIFSSTPASENDNNKKCDDDSENGEEESGERMAQAKILVLEVKGDYRGYDLGGLLFSEALMALKHRYIYADNDQQNRRTPDQEHSTRPTARASSVRCQLDAEEDIRRHNKLVGFYERLGCVQRKARPQFLNNNDGETYRKVPMQIDLKAPDAKSKPVWKQTIEAESLVGNPRGFLPVLLLGTRKRPSDSPQPNWLIIEDGQGHVQFRTTQGRYLTLDSQGRCVEKEIPGDFSVGDETAAPDDHLSKFQLLRVSDVTQPVISAGDDNICIDNENGKSSSTPWTGNELWLLVSSHGTFLSLDPVSHNLEGSITPTFWRANSVNFSLTCTSDTPTRRQHYLRTWIKQTVDYVQAAKTRYLSFNLARASLKEALDLTKACPGFPFRIDPSSRCLSLRTLCFRTAEAARAAGHPDWIQFTALIHALGSVVNCFDVRTAIESEDDYDWTVLCSSRIVGCDCPDIATFSEFRDFNEDQKDDRYNSPNGMYSAHCGLENVNLTWTGPEYLYNMLKHNQVDLPEEAFAVLRLFLLYDWHTKNQYENFVIEDDKEVHPFVLDFDRLRRRARQECLRLDELNDNDCERLWDSHYSAIAAKFGANDILEW